MKKSELILIIKKIQNRCALEFPTKVTYYWDKELDNQIVFKIFFDSLYLPQNLRVGGGNLLNSFSRSTFYEFEDEFQILEVNKDKGFIKVLPDDQNFKVVNSYKDAEKKEKKENKEEKKEEQVTLVSKKLSESFVSQKGFISLDEDEDIKSEVNNAISAQLDSSLDGAAVNKVDKQTKKPVEKVEEKALDVSVVNIGFPLTQKGFDYLKETLEKINMEIEEGPDHSDELKDDDSNTQEGSEEEESNTQENSDETQAEPEESSSEEAQEESRINNKKSLKEDEASVKSVVFLGLSDDDIKKVGMDPEGYKDYFATSIISGVNQSLKESKEIAVRILDKKIDTTKKTIGLIDEKNSKLIDVNPGADKLRLSCGLDKIGSMTPVSSNLQSEEDPSIEELKKIVKQLEPLIVSYRNQIRQKGGVRISVDYDTKLSVQTTSQAKDAEVAEEDSTSISAGEGSNLATKANDAAVGLSNKMKKAGANIKSKFGHLKGSGPDDWKKRVETYNQLIAKERRAEAVCRLAKVIYSKNAEDVDKEACKKHREALEKARNGNPDPKDASKIQTLFKSFYNNLTKLALSWKKVDFKKGTKGGALDDANDGMYAKSAGIEGGDGKDTKSKEDTLVSNWERDFPVWIVTDTDGSVREEFDAVKKMFDEKACALIDGATSVELQKKANAEEEKKPEEENDESQEEEEEGKENSEETSQEQSDSTEQQDGDAGDQGNAESAEGNEGEENAD